ncbi:hypothetical protein FNV43_RR13347 [Rhamnella rubrinervis]|uniref:DUF1985 domain-containing protein n=1 Tax=Rhamnella rubrinervis TaxID=2594499 RepID=A0A8K0H0W1_9ROSA|nr:hypothetical protein FNV43_RR13347 [Rhamnella rubrinervis]
MDSYVRMFTDNEMYSEKVTIKSFLNSTVNTIKEKLSTTQLAMFGKTCFGYFLRINELQFSGQVVNHMLWRQYICDDSDIMVFNFRGSDARSTIQKFCLISGLFCGPVPSTRPTLSGRFRDTYFSGKKFPLHNHNIVEVWGYETIPSLAAAFGIKLSTPECPRMQNWTISGMPNKNKLEDIFAGRGFEVVGVMLSNVHEMPLIAIVHHARGRKPSDIAPVVEDKLDVDVNTDRVHQARCKNEGCTDTPDVYGRHSAPSSRAATESTSVEVRLCAMEEKLSIMDRRISSIDRRISSMDSRQSSMDSRLSSMESKLDCLIKLFSSAYNTTGVQCFDEVGGEGVGVGDAHRTCDQRIDHAANHLVPPVSISSSPIEESKHSVKIFTQMSDRKLEDGRRKRRAARTIESPYDCQSLRWKMIHTLPVSDSVTFDPYRPVPDEVA